MTTAQDTVKTRANAIQWLDAQIAIFALAIDKCEAAKRAILVVTGATPEAVPQAGHPLTDRMTA